MAISALYHADPLRYFRTGRRRFNLELLEFNKNGGHAHFMLAPDDTFVFVGRGGKTARPGNPRCVKIAKQGSIRIVENSWPWLRENGLVPESWNAGILYERLLEEAGRIWQPEDSIMLKVAKFERDEALEQLEQVK